MQDFEIRIWGNTDKFQEFTAAKPSNGLLTSVDVERLGFKRLQAWNVQTFYSVFFCPKSYMLCCHFLVGYKTGVKFNHRMTAVALIVRRGYRLQEALTNLKKVYFLYLNFIEKNNVAAEVFCNTLVKKVELWEKELADNVIEDVNQQFVNCEEFKNRGYVSYALEEQLASFLDEPMRLDFKGACQIIFLQSTFVQKMSSLLLEQKYIAVQSAPKYQKKYALYFPDYNPHQPILLISSLDEFVKHTFERPGYKPIPLQGRLIDHVNDWKISESDDKTSYSIGLLFEPNDPTNGSSKKWRKWTAFLVVFVLGLLIGYVIGNSNSNRIRIVDTSNQSNLVDDDSYGVQEPISLTESEDVISDDAENENQRESDFSSENTTPLSTSSEGSYELMKLIKMLQGINYTHKDLARAKELAKEKGQYENYNTFFDGCEFALSVTTANTNRSADYVKNQLPKHTTLSEEQKDAINKIIEDIEVYNSNKNRYPTIKAMLREYW